VRTALGEEVPAADGFHARSIAAFSIKTPEYGQVLFANADRRADAEVRQLAVGAEPVDRRGVLLAA